MYICFTLHLSKDIMSNDTTGTTGYYRTKVIKRDKEYSHNTKPLYVCYLAKVGYLTHYENL